MSDIIEEQTEITQKDIDKEIDKRIMVDLSIDKDYLKSLKKKLSKVEHRSERGVETLLRLLSKNHYTLNTMIDTKSNILITINALILSLILGTVLSQLKDDPHLIVPSVLMLTTNLMSIYFAILATRPELKHGGRSVGNIMFYGDFQGMKEEDYVKEVTSLMHQGDKLYESIARDTYYLGQTINCKFLLLRRSFTIFLAGVFTAVIGFVACHVFF